MFTHNGGEIAERYKELLSEIPLACVTTADKIITLARERLPGKLHNIVYITLTDHIHFALQRHAEGLDIKMRCCGRLKALSGRVRRRPEALALIAQRLNTALPEDEAGFIALHGQRPA